MRANASLKYVFMVVKIPPKLSVTQFMGYLRGKSAIMIFESYANIDIDNSQRTFWMRGYYVSTIEVTLDEIEEYIRRQEMSNIM